MLPYWLIGAYFFNGYLSLANGDSPKRPGHKNSLLFKGRTKKPETDNILRSISSLASEIAKKRVLEKHISNSQAAAGYKCADHVSSILRQVDPSIPFLLKVDDLIRNLKSRMWSESDEPREGCLCYTQKVGTSGRSHVALLVESDETIPEYPSLTKMGAQILVEHNLPGRRLRREIKELEDQITLSKSSKNQQEMKNIIRQKRKELEYVGSNFHVASQSKQQRILETAQKRLGSLNIIHNQGCKLTYGPADYFDLEWMGQVKFLCPKF